MNDTVIIVCSMGGFHTRQTQLNVKTT